MLCLEQLTQSLIALHQCWLCFEFGYVLVQPLVRPRELQKGLVAKSFPPSPPIVAAFNKGAWTVPYMRLSMLKPSGDASMLLIARSVFLIISRINSGFLAASNVCPSVPGSLRICARSGLWSIISCMCGLLMIKVRIRSGLFIKFCTIGMLIISLTRFGSCSNCSCACWKSENPIPKPAPVPPPTPTPSKFWESKALTPWACGGR